MADFEYFRQKNPEPVFFFFLDTKALFTRKGFVMSTDAKAPLANSCSIESTCPRKNGWIDSSEVI